MRKEVRINSEGRIVIPAEMRKALNLKDNDVVIIEHDNGTLTVYPKQDRCGICNATQNLHRNGDLILCEECLEKINQNLKTIKEEFNHE